MAYDLHIIRTKVWTDAANAPITKQDVDALIAADSELSWSTSHYVNMTDEADASTRYYMIMWRGEPCFWWYRDQIQCSAPNEPQVAKLVQMAQALNAHTVGDDGESYPLEQTESPSTLLSSKAVRKPWWRFW